MRQPTSLMYAVQFGREAVIKLLVAARAEISIEDKRGFDASIWQTRPATRRYRPS
jgi:hypothetical protein